MDFQQHIYVYNGDTLLTDLPLIIAKCSLSVGTVFVPKAILPRWHGLVCCVQGASSTSLCLGMQCLSPADRIQKHTETSRVTLSILPFATCIFFVPLFSPMDFLCVKW